MANRVLIIPNIQGQTETPSYPEPPFKEVCPKIGTNIPCFNNRDCEIQIYSLINESGEYASTNCIPRCIFGRCQVLDIGTDYPIEIIPPEYDIQQSIEGLAEDLF